jgi:pimeloyl-[acyl-carrier protein] methyl ester esterase
MSEALPIFALHGWGMNAAVFDPLRDAFAGREFIAVDLPGHGRRHDEPLGRTLEPLVREMLAQAPPRAVWLGWSLGGMLALAAAAAVPERVVGLVTVAAGPSFIARPDWPQGMARENLVRMAEQLRVDPVQTVSDFLTLQVLSSRSGRVTLKHLKSALSARGLAGTEALGDGLKLLETLDLRPLLAALRTPLLAVSGARDRLVKPAAIRALVAAVPDAEMILFGTAAHAPFLSQRSEFVACVDDFLRRRKLP